MVLIEGVSVVIRCDAFALKYPGGWEAFLATRTNRTCADNEIAVQGFVSPQQARAFAENLLEQGLTSDHLAIVDSVWGLLTECDWLELGNTRLLSDARVTVCRLVGSTEERFVAPPDWTYDGSLSERAAESIH